MKYDQNLWDSYTDENIGNDQNPPKFINNICWALGVKKILEVGCNIGDNLEFLDSNFEVSGIDLNKNAIKKVKERYPTFNFKICPSTSIEFPDNSFDLVFTRTVLIHVPPEDMKKTTDELYRLSKKWIFNMEFFGENEPMIDWKRGKNLLWQRNMRKRWEEYNGIKVVSDVTLPTNIDRDRVRFTLIEKV